MKPAIQGSSFSPASVPLKMVGGNKYGRYSKISDEKTFNMIVSDDALVNYAGYAVRAAISSSLKGRAIYTSERWGRMLAVIGNSVYSLTVSPGSRKTLNHSFIGAINTFFGDISIDENIAGEIAICDGQEIYIFNWQSPTTPALVPVTLPVDERTGKAIVPGYITYHDGYFITVNEESASWFLSTQNQGTNWNWGASAQPVTTSIQTKPTNAIAAVRFPGRGSLIHVFGTNVTEPWYDTGAALFPYQRSTSGSIDYGCANASTIASMDNYMAWVGINEKSGPVIMVSTGGEAQHLSTDGIDFKLAALVNPTASFGFFFKQDGHVIYQVTFYDPQDNFTLIYDFNTKMFFYATDENMNYHIAKRVAFYNNTYYFVSVNDGNVYEFSSALTMYSYTKPNSADVIEYEIPRVRVCPPVRLDDSSRFLANNLTFTIEQGDDPYFQLPPTPGVMPAYQPRVDLSMSKDGSETFGSSFGKPLNTQGIRKNRLVYWQLGAANDLVFQARVWSKGRVVLFDGLVNIYQ